MKGSVFVGFIETIIATAITSCVVALIFFSADILRWFKYPYKVQYELVLRGEDWSGKNKVTCSLTPGDEIHHVGRGLPNGGDLVFARTSTQLYRVVLEDPLALGCDLDHKVILVHDRDINLSIERDQYLGKI